MSAGYQELGQAFGVVEGGINIQLQRVAGQYAVRTRLLSVNLN